MRKLFLFFFPFLVIFAIGFFVANSMYDDFKNGIIFENETNLEISKGETYYSLANKLELNEYFFKYYLKQNPPKKGLQAGTYKVPAGTNIASLIETLEGNAISQDISVTILEGYNIYDIDKILSEKGLIQAGDLVSYDKNNLENLKNEYPFLGNAITLEGFLYPDTYHVNPNNFSIENFVKNKLLANFKNKVVIGLNQENNSNLLNDVIMASIVEKEEKNKEEKATVAGVLKKRLNEGWQIGADATVCYPYEITFDECTQEFIVNHLYEKTDYNTRAMVGLPKTPICNPSVETIEATIYSEDSEYYYYLHGLDGQIHYGRNESEHVANKERYLK